eukprot:gene7719-5417_t
MSLSFQLESIDQKPGEKFYELLKLLTPGRTDTVTILSSTMEEKYKIIHSFTKKVFLIQRHEDGALFVMKRVPKHSIQEIDLLSSVSHPHIIRYIEHFSEESEEKEEDNQELKHDIAVDEKIHGDSPEAQNNEEGSDVKKRHDWNGEYVEVIFEYGSGGDLKKLLRERHERWREEMSQRRAQKSYQKADQNTPQNGQETQNYGDNQSASNLIDSDRIFFSEDEALLFFCPMVKALHYLHSHKVFHKDIKPENVFICWDGTVKLSDSSLRGGADLIRGETGGIEQLEDNQDVLIACEEKEKETEAQDEELEEAGKMKAPNEPTDASERDKKVIITFSNNIEEAVHDPNDDEEDEDDDDFPHPRDFSETARATDAIIEEEEGAEARTTENSDQERRNARGDVWALGCLLYEIVTLEPPFTGSTLLEYLNNLSRGDFKPIPHKMEGSLRRSTRSESFTNSPRSDTQEKSDDEEEESIKPPVEYSEDLQHLISRMLHPEPEKRITEEEILALPFLQPYLTWLEEREVFVRLINDQLVLVEEEQRGIFESLIQGKEEAEFRTLMQNHHAMMDLLERKRTFLGEVPTREREVAESEEEKMRYVEESAMLLELEVIARYEAHWRELLYQEHCLKYSLCQVHLSSVEAKYRLWLQDVVYANKLKGLRQARATDRLVVELTFSALHPHRELLPPIHKDTPNSEEEKLQHLRQLIVEDNANILYQGPQMERPILHEYLRRNVEAVRICFLTKTSLDFTVKDSGAEGKTPLHWIFCYSKTAAMLNLLLDRLERRGPRKMRSRKPDRTPPLDKAETENNVEKGEAQALSCLEGDVLPDMVDWSATDHSGNDFLSLAAYFGHLSLVWQIVKERRVRYFRKYKGPIPIERKIRLADWEQLCHRDRNKKIKPVCGIDGARQEETASGFPLSLRLYRGEPNRELRRLLNRESESEMYKTTTTTGHVFQLLIIPIFFVIAPSGGTSEMESWILPTPRFVLRFMGDEWMYSTQTGGTTPNKRCCSSTSRGPPTGAPLHMNRANRKGEGPCTPSSPPSGENDKLCGEAFSISTTWELQHKSNPTSIEHVTCLLFLHPPFSLCFIHFHLKNNIFCCCLFDFIPTKELPFLWTFILSGCFLIKGIYVSTTFKPLMDRAIRLTPPAGPAPERRLSYPRFPFSPEAALQATDRLFSLALMVKQGAEKRSGLPFLHRLFLYLSWTASRMMVPMQANGNGGVPGEPPAEPLQDPVRVRSGIGTPITPPRSELEPVLLLDLCWVLSQPENEVFTPFRFSFIKAREGRAKSARPSFQWMASVQSSTDLLVQHCAKPGAELDVDVIRRYVADGADVCEPFKPKKMKHPTTAIHEILERGSLDCITAVLKTETPIDFTLTGGRNRSSLLAALCQRKEMDVAVSAFRQALQRLGAAGSRDVCDWDKVFPWFLPFLCNKLRLSVFWPILKTVPHVAALKKPIRILGSVAWEDWDALPPADRLELIPVEVISNCATSTAALLTLCRGEEPDPAAVRRCVEHYANLFHYVPGTNIPMAMCCSLLRHPPTPRSSTFSHGSYLYARMLRRGVDVLLELLRSVGDRQAGGGEWSCEEDALREWVWHAARHGVLSTVFPLLQAKGVALEKRNPWPVGAVWAYDWDALGDAKSCFKRKEDWEVYEENANTSGLHRLAIYCCEATPAKMVQQYVLSGGNVEYCVGGCLSILHRFILEGTAACVAACLETALPIDFTAGGGCVCQRTNRYPPSLPRNEVVRHGHEEAVEILRLLVDRLAAHPEDTVDFSLTDDEGELAHFGDRTPQNPIELPGDAVVAEDLAALPAKSSSIILHEIDELPTRHRQHEIQARVVVGKTFLFLSFELSSLFTTCFMTSSSTDLLVQHCAKPGAELDADVIRQYVADGADICAPITKTNGRPSTVLCEVVERGSLDAITALLETLRTIEFGMAFHTVCGRQNLFLATNEGQHGHEEAVEILKLLLHRLTSHPRDVADFSLVDRCEANFLSCVGYKGVLRYFWPLLQDLSEFGDRTADDPAELTEGVVDEDYNALPPEERNGSTKRERIKERKGRRKRIGHVLPQERRVNGSRKTDDLEKTARLNSCLRCLLDATCCPCSTPSWSKRRCICSPGLIFGPLTLDCIEKTSPDVLNHRLALRRSYPPSTTIMFGRQSRWGAHRHPAAAAQEKDPPVFDMLHILTPGKARNLYPLERRWRVFSHIFLFLKELEVKLPLSLETPSHSPLYIFFSFHFAFLSTVRRQAISLSLSFKQMVCCKTSQPTPAEELRMLAIRNVEDANVIRRCIESGGDVHFVPPRPPKSKKETKKTNDKKVTMEGEEEEDSNEQAGEAARLERRQQVVQDQEAKMSTLMLFAMRGNAVAFRVCMETKSPINFSGNDSNDWEDSLLFTILKTRGGSKEAVGEMIEGVVERLEKKVPGDHADWAQRNLLAVEAGAKVQKPMIGSVSSLEQLVLYVLTPIYYTAILLNTLSSYYLPYTLLSDPLIHRYCRPVPLFSFLYIYIYIYIYFLLFANYSNYFDKKNNNIIMQSFVNFLFTVSIFVIVVRI